VTDLDLEMTRLCAEAMGVPLTREMLHLASGARWTERIYDPLRDDAQAMALVKRFEIDLSARRNCASVFVGPPGQMKRFNSEEDCDTINRAIVQCVAKMRADKTSAMPIA